MKIKVTTALMQLREPSAIHLSLLSYASLSLSLSFYLPSLSVFVSTFCHPALSLFIHHSRSPSLSLPPSLTFCLSAFLSVCLSLSFSVRHVFSYLHEVVVVKA